MNPRRLFALLFVLLGVLGGRAASVTAVGYTNDFSSQPAAVDFSTRSIGSAGTTGVTEIQTAAALDSAVQTNSAALITAPCASATGNPPLGSAGAVWASAGGYLQTRPAQNAATLLLATLMNDTGTDGTGARIGYNFSNRVAASQEQVIGHRVYYSLSGAPNTWSVISALSQTGSGNLIANVGFTAPWTNGGKLYLLWADENGTSNPDDALNLDNFSIGITGTNGSCLLLSPADGQSLPDTNAVRFVANAAAAPGERISGIGFYDVTAGALGSALTLPYALDKEVAPGTYSAYAIATNSSGEIYFSATNTFTVTNVPLTIVLLTPTNGTSYGSATNVTLSVSAYAGKDATITGVGFFDATRGFIGAATAEPYRINSDFHGGTFAIYAVATNSLGATVISQTNRVFVNAPPVVAAQTPPAGSFVATITQIEVTFDQAVTGVNAADLLINGVPATSVIGTNASYTFTCTPPNATVANVTWAANHGIVNLGTPPYAFNAAEPSATWSYTTSDRIAPSLRRVDPPASAMVKNLTKISVYFDEPVTGVDASDLRINDAPAQGLTGSGSGPYAFTFSRPATGAVQVVFAPGHGIADLASPANAFAGGGWSYTLNPAIPADIAVTHVVQISLDGLAAVHLRNYVTNAPDQFPSFVRLMNEAAFTMNARCDYDISETVPNHTTMFTGRPVFQPAGLPNTTHHGYNNNFPTATETLHNSGNTNVPYKSSMFDVAHDYGRTTAFYAGKTRLAICERSYNETNGALDLIGVDNGRDKIDFSSLLDLQGAAIVSEVDTILADLTNATPREYIFIHIAEPDLTGHAASWGSPTWSNIVRSVDTQLGRIINAIDTNPALINQTALIVVADHGGGGVTPNAHTEAYHINNYTIPFFLRAPGIAGGTDLYQLFSNRADPGTNRTDYTTAPQPIRNGDASNLALSLMALPPIPGSFMMPIFATPAVALRLARYNGQVTVFWADANDEYDLQTTMALGTHWDTVLSGITTNETTKVYSISATPSSSKQFFRLQKK
ncbi:MAG TPA: alkaline phosphatase family protein [Verrucomicrobiae bacterium]|nr:alkaline phosphatase family protein [Verrucomicrobiae bacterium]